MWAKIQLPSYGEALQASTLPPKEGGRAVLPPAYINTTVLEAGEACPCPGETTTPAR